MEQNHTKRIQKEHANDEYGRKLKEQVDEHIRKKELAINETNTFAALEDATAKRTEEMQKGRVQDAIRRQKQFIQHALDDIATKHAKHELFLKEELTASTIMVNNAKKMMGKSLL